MSMNFMPALPESLRVLLRSTDADTRATWLTLIVSTAVEELLALLNERISSPISSARRAGASVMWTMVGCSQTTAAGDDTGASEPNRLESDARGGLRRDCAGTVRVGAAGAASLAVEARR